MKYRSIAIFAGILLPLTIQANTYQASMERLSPENPEFLFHVDLEKDFSLLGDFLTEAYLAYQTASPTASPVPVNYEQLFARLGLTNLRSATFTSERSGDSNFFNQGMFLFAGAPGGAFLLMGDSNEPFTVLSSVPADAAFFAESGLSGPALLGIIRNIAVDMMGPMGQGLIDAQLLQPITPDGLTAQDIINRLDTRVHIAIKPDAVPDSKSLPAMAMLNGKFAIRIMGIGDLLDSLAPILQGTGFIPLREDDTSAWKFIVPSPELPLTVYLESIPQSNDLLLTLSEQSKDWLLSSSEPIATSPEVMSALDKYPESGLSLWYDDGTLSDLQIDNLLSQMEADQSLAPVMASIVALLKRFSGPQSGVSFLEEDAYRVMSRQPTSYKTQAALTGVAIPLGVLGSMSQMQDVDAILEEDVPGAGETD